MNRRIRTMMKLNSDQQSETAKVENGKNVRFEQNPVRSTSIENRHRSVSILKNKRSQSAFQGHRMRSGSTNSLAGFNPKEDQVCQNFTLNKVVKQQYNKLLQKHSAKFKYTDDIFPPNITSLFTYANRKSNKDTKIIWKRIHQVFPGRNLTVMGTDPLRNFIRPSTELSPQFFSLSFNCLKNNRPLMKRIFESNKINEEGVYCLKIFQTNVWKYIIIDDYIPVFQQNQKKGITYIPAFLTGQISRNRTQPIQIWPYLLEKAYAKYYSSYEALSQGNVWDFIEQISNENYQEIDLQSTQINIKEMFRRPQLIILGDHIDGKLTPVFSAIGISDRIYFLNPDKAGYKSIIKPQNICQHFVYLYVFGLSKYSYVGFCPIKQIKQSISVRTFTVKHPQKCAITLVQKDQKFFKGKVKYQYSWIRMIILQKEFHEGYRWIDGRYGNYKSIFMELKLEKGEYYVVIMPQWNLRAYDLNLFIRAFLPIRFDRKQFQHQIIEQGCSDLAQRFGRMNQLNHYICSYNCIHEDLGLIIENINNQKPTGNIRIMRSIDGLQASLPIEPFNKEFIDKKDLEILVKANEEYTVVLMMKGGLDRQFFQNFDFGSD